MIFSMTGFAVASADLPGSTLSLELRSVNHRYLEIAFRMGDEFRQLEPGMREMIASGLGRGKVECRLSHALREGGQHLLHLDETLVARLAELNRTVKTRLPDAQDLGVADVLKWPGVLSADGPSVESLRNTVFGLLQTALEDFRQTRAREGVKLKEMLLDRAEKMSSLIAGIAPTIPELVSAYQAKLTARLREALAEMDEERIRHEMAIFAQKIDVDEELSRLGAHLDELARILAKGGTVGKRLDFLMQELNREANTLGSKSVSTELTRVAMELKVLIEQMREQIQNIE